MHSKKIITFMILGVFLAFLGAGCNPFANNDQPGADSVNTAENLPQENVPEEKYGDQQMADDTALSNPATVYCLSRDGDFNMKKTLAGTTEGYCTLPDGTECEVWALYKGDCAALSETDEVADDESATSTDLIATSTDDSLTEGDNYQSTTGTSMTEDESSEDSQDSIESDQDINDSEERTSEKKKAEGEIDIAVKPGEETGEIIMSWDTHDLQAPDGYIVMLSGSDDLSYPTRFYHELDREESYSFTWIELNPEREYFFRVCIKQGEGCGTYSPVIGTYPKAEEGE